MNVGECLNKGLLKKDNADLGKAKRSLEVARFKLTEADSLFNIKMFDMCLVNAYSSMFHSARSLLFKDGFKERSHYALYVYLNEKYKDRIEPRFLNELNLLRLERHDVFYSLEIKKIESQEAEDALILAKDFLKAVEKLI
jgi:uncharacterized protein (UPF0332 family)